MRKAISQMLAVLGLAALIAGCAGDDLGTQFTEISEADSGLLFYGPGLAGGYRRFLTGRDEQHVKRTTGLYGPREGEFPRASMHFMEMPPGRHFTRIAKITDAIEAWGWFKERKTETGAQGTAVNRPCGEVTGKLSGKISCARIIRIL